MGPVLEQIFAAIRQLAGRVDWQALALDPDFQAGLALIIKAFQRHVKKD